MLKYGYSNNYIETTNRGIQKMWIKIDGEDKVNDIADHYVDNETKLINIKFKNSYKYYTYPWKKVDIGPIKTISLKENEVLVHKNKYKKVRSYTMIGDAIILLKQDGKKIYYKTENLKKQIFKDRPLNDNEFVIIKYEIKDVYKIESIDGYYRITYIKNGATYMYNKTDVQIKKHDNVNYMNLLKYFKEIAMIKDLKTDKDIENYLEKQLEKMVIQEESALKSYFSRSNQVYDFNKQIIYPFGINLSQKKAIKNALSNKLSLIQGPPGTGKTQSILNILANIVVNEQTVGVVSSNNEAVKNVKEKMEKEGYGFLIAFLGKRENKANFFENQTDYPIYLENWKLSEADMIQLLKEIGEHERTLMLLLEQKNNLSELCSMLSEYEHEYNYFKDYLKNNDVDKLHRLSFFKLNNQQVLNLLVDLNYMEEDSFKLYKKIYYLFKYGIYNFSQFEKKNRIILDLQEQYYKSKIHELENSIEIIKNDLIDKNFENELKQLTLKSKRYFEGYLAKRYKGNRSIFHIKTYRDGQNFPSFQNEYPIILSTTHAMTNSINNCDMLDFLIVDEATQVELMPGILALSTAKRAVIVGDLKQLPHIPDEQIKQNQYESWHSVYSVPSEYSYKEQNLLSSFIAIYGNEIANVLLKEHYRCQSKIIGFCNKKYYNNELIYHSKVNSSKPLVLLKTASGNHMRYGKNAVNKITNLRELESIMDKEFLDKIALDFNDKKNIGFIAPFRGQVNESDKVLPSEFQKDTVHKFQGRECDLVIFSTVLDEKSVSKRRMTFVDEPHLVNVAISRAIEKFILVSDVDVFKDVKGEICDLIRYMEYYEEDSILHHSNVRSIFDLLYSDYKDILDSKRNKQGWKKSKFDSENLASEHIENILIEEDYNSYKYSSEVRLKELIRNYSLLTLKEKDYIDNNARIDFLIYNKFDNQPILAIEVDGFKFHENNPKQMLKDKLKDSILQKYEIPILRLKTNSSQEKEKIKSFL